MCTRPRDFELSPTLMISLPNEHLRWGNMKEHLHSTPSMSLLCSLKDKQHRKATTRAILESFALPRRSVKKNILAAQAEYDSNYPSFLLLFYPLTGYVYLNFGCSLMFLPLFLDQDPGNIEVLMDLILEKWRNVPEARQLGEESAKFFCQEMEGTWGQGHLTVLSEDEAQKWLLGVSLLFLFLFRTKNSSWSIQKLHKYFKIASNALILSTNRTLFRFSV